MFIVSDVIAALAGDIGMFKWRYKTGFRLGRCPSAKPFAVYSSSSLDKSSPVARRAAAAAIISSAILWPASALPL